MTDYLDVIEQFKRLTPNSRRKIAEEFTLMEADDAFKFNKNEIGLANQWLLRAYQRKIMDKVGQAVQLAAAEEVSGQQ
jgi:hypothetical protein